MGLIGLYSRVRRLSVRAACSHSPEKLTHVTWGHASSDAWDCECGESFYPGTQAWADLRESWRSAGLSYR